MTELAISNLILRHFTASRLNTYDQVACYVLDGSIVGAIGLFWLDDKLCLNQLCVDTQYRKQGIASRLLAFVSETYHADQMLYVDKHKPNTNSLVHFYTKRGFCVVEPQNDVEFLLIKAKCCQC